MNLDDDGVDQQVLKASRELAKRSVVELGHRPDNLDAYVAGTAKAKRELHGARLRELIVGGVSACEAADQIEAETVVELDDVLARFTRKPSGRPADHTVATGKAHRRLMEEHTANLRSRSAEWTPPTEDEMARVKTLIAATKEQLRTPKKPEAVTMETANATDVT